MNDKNSKKVGPATQNHPPNQTTTTTPNTAPSPELDLPLQKPLPGFSPYAPVLRSGHYDHIPVSLVPKDVDKDAIPRHPLEKSSSSFLKGIQTPPSTPSEEEAGVLGINMLCITKKKHYVDNKFHLQEIALHFADVMIVFAIFLNVPCLLLQMLYVFYHEFRFVLLLHYTVTVSLFFSFLVVSIFLKFFTGMARTSPWHIILTVFKAILWAWIYTLGAALVEHLYIEEMVYEHLRNERDLNAYLLNATKDKAEVAAEEYKVYTQFVTKVFTDEDLIVEEDVEEAEVKAENVFFLAGIVYAICLMLLLRILRKLTKLNYFGPILPFISYTITFLMILACTIFFLISKNSKTDDDDKLWMLVQATCGPLIGVIITELFILYLRALLRGRLCPLRRDEYMYAAAHY